MQNGKISNDDLRLLLSILPQFAEGLTEIRADLLSRDDLFFSADVTKASWYRFYELPAREHFIAVAAINGHLDLVQGIAQSEDQVKTVVTATSEAITGLGCLSLTDEEKDNARKGLQAYAGNYLSVFNSFRSMLIFGLYLNDLVAIVKRDGREADAALIKAVKIDPTVLACESAARRISRAVLRDDQEFLGRVRRAMSGKLTKREQKNYQKIRLVLEVLYEAGAPKLGQDDLYELFVEELNLVRGESDLDEGNVANNLRQFAYQFMKQKAVS